MATESSAPEAVSEQNSSHSLGNRAPTLATSRARNDGKGKHNRTQGSVTGRSSGKPSTGCFETKPALSNKGDNTGLVRDRSQTRTTMLRALAKSNKPGDGDGQKSGAIPGGKSGISLKSMLLVKRRLTRWRDSKMKTWNMIGGQSQTSTTSSMENSYRMTPEDSGRFFPEKIKVTAKSALERVLASQTGYDPQKASLLSRLASEEIKTDVKKLEYNRYKVVVHVLIGQDVGQGVQASSRAVWDTGSDRSTTVTYRKADMFVVASIFGVYYE